MSPSSLSAPYLVGTHAKSAPLLMKSRPDPTLQLWDRITAWDSPVFPAPGQGGTQTSHHGVSAQLGITCC